MCRRLAAFSLAVFVGACATDPSPPMWRAEAKGWLDTAVESYLRGETRPAEVAFSRAQREIAASARLDLAARAELAWCAARIASAVYDHCRGFDPLRDDSRAESKAYATYLYGRVDPAAVRLLPEAHRVLASGELAGGQAAAQLRAIADPLSRLVALGVLFRSGRANIDAIAIGVDTASERGWRRPLLAWLEIQAAAFDRAGKTQEATQARRRIDFVVKDIRGQAPFSR